MSEIKEEQPHSVLNSDEDSGDGMVSKKCQSLISGLTVSMVNEQTILDDKLKSLEDEPSIDFSTAFLGPVLWEKTLPFDEEDFKLESLGLADFFEENDLLQAGDVSPQVHHQQVQQPQLQQPQLQQQMGPPQMPMVPAVQHVTQHIQPVRQQVPQPTPPEENLIEPEPSFEPTSTEESDVTLVTIPGHDGFDPSKRRFSEEELKPQPMIKKSKKVYVPDDLKDNAYWGRRNKNNAAAKRSRDARRVKENQIAMRAGFLEKQNGTLKSELEKVQLENIVLKKRLSQYEVQAKLSTM